MMNAAGMLLECRGDFFFFFKGRAACSMNTDVAQRQIIIPPLLTSVFLLRTFQRNILL